MLLSRTTIATLAPIVTDDPTRYSLHSVQLTETPEGLTATATDGHVLLTITEPITPDTDWPAGPADSPTRGEHCAGPVVVPMGTLAAAVKVMGKAPKHGAIPVLHMARVATVAGVPTVQATDLAARVAIPAPQDNARFPDPGRVIPAADAPMVAHLTLSADMLAQLGKAIKVFHAGGYSQHGGTVTLSIPAAALNSTREQADDRLEVTGAIRLTATGPDGRTLTGALMGCRR